MRDSRTVIVATICTVASASLVWADASMKTHTIDCGGVMQSQSTAFRLSGTIGQFDAGKMSGHTFKMVGGFWNHALFVAPGDCDGDGDTDLLDFEDFADCLRGPGIELGAGCYCADVTGDGDVDLADFAVWQEWLGDSD